MDDFIALAETHADVPDEELKKAGQAIGGPMGAEHTEFVKMITKLITEGTIDFHQPETILNRPVYDVLDEAHRSQVDQAMVNIADMLRHITEFYVSKQTPDSSPQLETMIEQLWLMKNKVEAEHGDVFIF